MEMIYADELTTKKLKALNTHAKQSALEVKLCNETLSLCNTKSPVDVEEMAVSLIETVMLYARLHGIRPHQLKDSLIARCEEYIANQGGNNHDLN